MDGKVAHPQRWTWEQFQALPRETPRVDIHCVTKWSKLDTNWEGVSLDALLEPAEPVGDYLIAHCDGDYTTNPTDDLPLWVRIGVHFGRPVRRGQDLIGHDVNVAARIVQLAAPGEVLVSEACIGRVAEQTPEIHFEEVGPTVMKGIPEPIALYRAVMPG